MLEHVRPCLLSMPLLQLGVCIGRVAPVRDCRTEQHVS